jgi:polyphosphate kinase 2 (PPK2 family)
VTSFKAPTSEDLDHDYLWRCVKALPERGRIGIFNRSYYEETLVVRACIPSSSLGRNCPPNASQRTSGTSAFRTSAASSATSRETAQLSASFFSMSRRRNSKSGSSNGSITRTKNWKFSANDARERGFWDKYMEAYEETIRETATEDSPWYAVPADRKWFTRAIVAAAVIDALS